MRSSGLAGNVEATDTRNLRVVPYEGTTKLTNAEITGLASGSRSASTNSSDLTNNGWRGGIFTIKATAVGGGGDTIQLRVQGKDGLSGEYYDILTDGTFSSTSTRTVVVYPSADDLDGQFHDKNDVPLPRTFRVRVVHSSGSSFTYSVGVTLIV